MITEYGNFLNETKMDIERPFLLFSDIIRTSLLRGENEFEMFADFYAQPRMFFALSEISQYRTKLLVKNHGGVRFTLLRASTYRDNTLEGRKSLTNEEVEYILAHRNEYYFYDLVKGRRRANEAPNREDPTNIQHGDDGEDWYFIIKKGINCSLVKTESREESGNWAEKQLATNYGWQKQQTSIVVKKFKLNNVAVQQTNNFLRQILDRDDIEMFRVDEDENTYSKYDLIIDEEFKIEIKKYSENKLFSNGRPKPIMLAEQFKIADRSSLKKLVRWYYESTNDPLGLELWNKSEREISDLFKGNTPIIRNIKRYHNSKIGRMQNVLNRVPQERWMEGVFGIYFAPERSNRRNDFLIKINDENRRNIVCVWETIEEQWGLDRLKLMMRMNGESIEYIISPNNIFIPAYKLKDHSRYKESRRAGILECMDGNTYVFNIRTNRWERRV